MQTGKYHLSGKQLDSAHFSDYLVSFFYSNLINPSCQWKKKIVYNFQLLYPHSALKV